MNEAGRNRQLQSYTMEKLSDDLTRMILERKMVNDNVSLVVDDGYGVILWVSRNLNDPPYFMRFSVPSIDTKIFIIHKRRDNFNGDETNRVVCWEPTLLIRSYMALEELVSQAVRNGAAFTRRTRGRKCYYYTQGDDGTPPSYMAATDTGNAWIDYVTKKAVAPPAFTGYLEEANNDTQSSVMQIARVLDVIKKLVGEM